MTFEAVIIRQAEDHDTYDIWDLLHTNSIGWGTEEIMANIDQLLVIQQHQKLLGVLCKPLSPEKDGLEWVVIHPLYPEKPLQDILIQSLFSIERCALQPRAIRSKGQLNPCLDN